MSLRQQKSVIVWIGRRSSPESGSAPKSLDPTEERWEAFLLSIPGTTLASTVMLQELSSYLTSKGWSVQECGPGYSSRLPQRTTGSYLARLQGTTGWTTSPSSSLMDFTETVLNSNESTSDTRPLANFLRFLATT